MLPDINDAEWPIVDIKYGRSITFEEIASLGEALRKIVNTRGPIVALADISSMDAGATTALHRKKIAEEADKISAMRGFIGEAVIIRNPLVRALFVGYSWARSRPNHPVEVFADRAAALEWARKLCGRWPTR